MPHVVIIRPAVPGTEGDSLSLVIGILEISLRPARLPKGFTPRALPVRPERHVPTSIATAYELLARALLQRLPCRSCGRPPETG